jgi:hypothetical protein
MILKRSDKLIAIIGVIILIIAGIGIFIYISNEDDSDDDLDDGNKNEFMVEWIQEDHLIKTTGYAGRKGSYSETITNTIYKEPLSVLLNVEIRVIWKDTQNYGRFLRSGPIKVGQDSLSAEFTYDGESKMIPSHTGQGNKSEQFSIYNKPSDQLIEDVEDYNEALQMIIEEYNDMDSASIDVKVMVDPGERFAFIFRPLMLWRYITDTGENFDLEITYTYCYPVINPIDEDGNEPPTSIKPSGDRPAYSMMCLPGML